MRLEPIGWYCRLGGTVGAVAAVGTFFRLARGELDTHREDNRIANGRGLSRQAGTVIAKMIGASEREGAHAPSPDSKFV